MAPPRHPVDGGPDYNAKMLVNIRTVRGKDAIQVNCNSGIKMVNRVGDLPGYGTVWY